MAGKPSSAKGTNDFRKVFLAQYRDPVRLRVGVAVLLAAVWYLAAFKPLVGRVEAARGSLDAERKKLAVAEQIDILRTEVERFEKRLPERADINEAMQYLLNGVKSMPVKLTALDPGAQKDFGPYKVASFTMSAEGTYPDVDALLRWVEANPRVLRVDTIGISPARDTDARPGAQAASSHRFTITMTILGVLG